MFNLLRRRLKGKKHNNKNKYNIDVQQQNDDHEPKYLVNKQKNENIATTTKESVEYYRQFIECDEHDVKTQPNAVVTAANVGSSINDEEEKEEQKERIGTCMNMFTHANNGATSRQKMNAINDGKNYVENSHSENKRQWEKGEYDEQQQQQRNYSTYRNNEDSNIGTAFVATPSTSSSIHTFDNNENDNDDDQQRQKTKKQVKDEQRHSQEQQVEYVRSDRETCGFSHNEQAEWQRRVLKIGEIENLSNRNNNNKNNNTNNNIIEIITNEHTRTIKNNCRENILQKTLFKNDVGNPIKSNEIGKTTTTTPTVNNEVKYRNLDKKKSRNEAKSQSRLSFTFTGISFIKKKFDEDHVKNDKLVNDKVSKSEKPAKKTETTLNLHNRKEKSKSEKNLGPLQKSREFLNDLFMARGRHNNRHRHQQQQQPAHQTKQQGGESRKNATLHGGGSGGGGVTHAVVSDVGGNGSNNNNRHVSIKNNVLQDKSNNGKNKTDDEIRVSGSEGSMSEHLELNSDRASDSTNTYQIPSAKNSAKNFQTNASTTAERERSQQIRSNSAKYAREQNSPNKSAEISWENNDVLLNTAEDVEKAKDNFIRTAHIGRYGTNTANENSAVDNNIDGDTHGEPAEAGVIPSSTTAYEDTNHLIKASSLISSATTTTNYKLNESNEINTSSGCSSSNNNKNNKLNKIVYLSNASTLTNMGQTNAKPSDTSVNMSREFRESSVTSSVDKVQSVQSQPINVELPTITVADYSGGVSCEQSSSPVDKEIFYEFDKNDHMPISSDDQHINIMEANYDEFSDVFYNGAATSMPITNDQHNNNNNNNNNNKWQTPNNLLSQSQMRHNHVKLEDVREENEDEEEEDRESDVDEEEESENSEDNNMKARRHHLDNELYKSSSERSPLKSSDTTLSGSPSDSGIGTDSQPETPLTLKNRNSPSFKLPATTPTYTQQLKQQYRYMSFVRDGNSTDCDDVDVDVDIDLADDDGSNERLVCIESISLPDVVVESTTASSSSAALSSASSTASGEHIININGASGNNIGNVHFIPIHIEGTKKRSVDDSCIGGK